MAVPIRTNSFSALLAPGIYRVYMETGRRRPLEFPQWVNVIDMPWQGYANRQISGLGPMGTKPEGGQFPMDAPILGNQKTHTSTSYGSGFEVTYEMWRDELYGVMDMLASELRRISNYRMEVDAHNALNFAFSTSAFTTFDGAALASASHVGLDGVTRSNINATSVQVGLTGLQAAITSFHGQTNERNIPVAQSMASVGVPYQFWATVRETLGSESKPFTADNEINALMQEDVTYWLSHYFTSATAWFAIAEKGEHDLNFNIMDRPLFDYFDDPRTWNAVYVCYQAHEPSQADEWRGVYGSQG
jgi:hypothetical protein